jgi:hypothetical protein
LLRLCDIIITSDVVGNAYRESVVTAGGGLEASQVIVVELVHWRCALVVREQQVSAVIYGDSRRSSVSRSGQWPGSKRARWREVGGGVRTGDFDAEDEGGLVGSLEDEGVLLLAGAQLVVVHLLVQVGVHLAARLASLRALHTTRTRHDTRDIV